MDSGRATIRNMRSKCRCSYVLQFTFRHAVCCVLHRPPSQVIHCIVLFIQKQLTRIGLFHKKQKKVDSSSQGGESNKVTQARAKIFERICHHRSINGAPHPKPRAAGKHNSSRANKLRTLGSQQRPATGRQASSPRISLLEENSREFWYCKVLRL